MFSLKYFSVSLWILISSIHGCIMAWTRQLWQLDRKSCSFQSLFKHIFRSFEGRWKCKMLPKTMPDVARPPSHIRQVGQKAPCTHLHLIWVVSPNFAELSQQKQTIEPFFEASNHATSNLNDQYEKWQRVMPVPSCELKTEAWSEFTCVCNVEGRQMKWHHTSCWDDDNVTSHCTYFCVS